MQNTSVFLESEVKLCTKGALIAVLYEFAFLSEKLFHKTELFFRSNLNLNDDCIFAKTIAIYGKCLFDRLKGQNHGFDKTSDGMSNLNLGTYQDF